MDKSLPGGKLNLHCRFVVQLASMQCKAMVPLMRMPGPTSSQQVWESTLQGGLVRLGVGGRQAKNNKVVRNKNPPSWLNPAYVNAGGCCWQGAPWWWIPDCLRGFGEFRLKSWISSWEGSAHNAPKAVLGEKKEGHVMGFVLRHLVGVAGRGVFTAPCRGRGRGGS